MASEADRMARAGNYVLGLMNEAERERAERDLERDALFRDAVLSVAEQMRVVSAPSIKAGTEERWRTISASLADLPQMRGVRPAAETEASGSADVRSETVAVPAKPAMLWRAPFAAPKMLNVVLAACLIAVFAAGYIAGVSSLGFRGAEATVTAGTVGNP